MTADSLKAFITLPTTTIYKKDAGNQRAKLFCFSLFLAAFCVTVSCYQIWNFLRTNELRTEVDLLRDKVESMRKRMGLELFDDLDDFENVYAPHPEDSDEEEDLENNVFSDDLNDFDEDIEDEEYDDVYNLDGELKLQPEDDEMETGSGRLLDDDYDIIRESSNQRKPRAVVSPVAVVEESYAVRRNKTSPSVDDHLSQLLLRKSGSPKMQHDWTQQQKADRNSGRHQQPPRRHMKKYLEHRAPPTLYVTKPATDDNRDEQPQVHIRHNNHHSQQQQQQKQQLRTHQQEKHREERQRLQDTNRVDNNTARRHITTEPPPPVHVRESRVMATNEDKSQAFRQTITKREYARLKALQSPSQFVEAKAHPELIAYPPSRRLVRKSGSGSGKVARQVSSRPRLIAVQFNGDTSRYEKDRRHDHYHGNGLLQHVGGVYRDFSPAPWVSNMALDRYFNMDEGVVTVREPGLYYIYAQIYYKDEHDTNGFVIEHNDNQIMQCSTMTPTTHRVSKANTCHTGGVTFLRADDTVKIKDVGHHRYVILDSDKSFFGLVKLASISSQRQVQAGLTDSATMGPNFF